MDTFTDSIGQVLGNVHSKDDCKGACPIHNPSAHHMRSWPLVWRGDRGIFERQCPHGIGHPDPDTMSMLGRKQTERIQELVSQQAPTEEIDEALDEFDEGVHGCDGCCARQG